VAHVPGETIDDDVAHELDRLRGAGIGQAILVDLTRPDVGVPVVRMVVPGLEGWTDKVAPAVAGPRRRALRER
jgi:ribosomal protein S12 methylthiotransferase accessory factor